MTSMFEVKRTAVRSWRVWVSRIQACKFPRLTPAGFAPLCKPSHATDSIILASSICHITIAYAWLGCICLSVLTADCCVHSRVQTSFACAPCRRFNTMSHVPQCTASAKRCREGVSDEQGMKTSLVHSSPLRGVQRPSKLARRDVCCYVHSAASSCLPRCTCRARPHNRHGGSEGNAGTAHHAQPSPSARVQTKRLVSCIWRM